MWLSEEYMIENETTEEWPFRMRAVCAIHCLQGDTCSLQCSLSASAKGETPEELTLTPNHQLYQWLIPFLLRSWW